MENLVNKKQALNALKEGKKVKTETSIFEAVGINKDVIVDHNGFLFTSFFKLYAGDMKFEIV